MRKDFYYIDFAAKYQPGFRNNIVNVRDVPGLVRHLLNIFYKENLYEVVIGKK